MPCCHLGNNDQPSRLFHLITIHIQWIMDISYLFLIIESGLLCKNDKLNLMNPYWAAVRTRTFQISHCFHKKEKPKHMKESSNLDRRRGNSMSSHFPASVEIQESATMQTICSDDDFDELTASLGDSATAGDYFHD